jgi:hypothetical protein
MKRNISKALAILMTLALIMTLAAVTAFAYTPINGGSTSDLFKKYLTVDADAQIPNASFEFAINAGTAVPGGDGNALEILAGPVVESNGEITAPTVAPATFTSGMRTTTGLPTDPDHDSPTTTDKKFAESGIAFNFTGVTFSAPGVYRYEVTEKATDFEGVTIDNGTRYLDVFVFPSESDPDVLEITTYSLRDAATSFERVEDPAGSGNYKYQYVTNPTKKTDGFYNELETVDLQFSKKIEGNQADMTKRFAYTLELSDVNPGTYTLTFSGDATAIIGDNESVVPGDNSDYTIVVPADGDNARSYTGTFYLTNGDVVTVNELNTGYNYTVTEDEEDYQKTANVDNDGDDNDFTDNYTGTGITAPLTKVGWTNTREGAIPTGVILTIAPFMIGLLLFGAVMMFMISRRRRATY